MIEGVDFCGHPGNLSEEYERETFFLMIARFHKM